jgi:hypothetical protein
MTATDLEAAIALCPNGQRHGRSLMSGWLTPFVRVALSGRGISNCNDIEGPIDKSLGTKEALAVRLRKLAIDGEKTLQGVAELAYQQCFQV